MEHLINLRKVILAQFLILSWTVSHGPTNLILK